MTVFLFSPARQGTEWLPAADIYRVADGWILKFDVAGVRLEDVQVHIGSRSVTVSGVRRDWLLEEAGCRHYSMEITYSRFQRTIELPESLKNPEFRLDYRDGLLFVRIASGEETNNE